MEKTELACKIMQLAIDNNSDKVDRANAIIKATELIEVYRTEQLILSGVSNRRKLLMAFTLYVVNEPTKSIDDLVIDFDNEYKSH